MTKPFAKLFRNFITLHACIVIIVFILYDPTHTINVNIHSLLPMSYVLSAKYIAMATVCFTGAGMLILMAI